MTKPKRSLMLLLAGLLLAAGVPPEPAAAQQGPIYLQPGHWTYDAVRRLNVLGVAPASSDPALAHMTLQHARRVFESSRATARARGRAAAAVLAADYLRLLDATEGRPDELRLRAGAGVVELTGELLAAEFMVTPWELEPPRPLDPVRGGLLTVGGHGALAARVGWRVEAALLHTEPVLPAAVLGAALGPFDAWAGRQRVHYGAGRGGGIVSGNGWLDEPLVHERSTLSINGAGIAVRDPFHFPAFLRFLGPDRIEVVAGRLEAVGEAEGAYLVLGRLTGTPFSRRFTLGLNRGAVFGGTGRPVTLGRLWGLLVGLYQDDDVGVRSGFENQVISGIVRYRPPIERVLPLELFLEFGAEDMAGAVRDNSAIVAGVDVAALPGLPAVSMSLEHAQFAAGTSGTGENVRLWYINFAYGGAWSDAGRAIAHPLGGIGREWQLRTAWDAPARGIHAAATAFTRKRWGWGMYTPDRAGDSVGGTLSLGLRPAPHWDVRGFALLEDGDGWLVRRLVLRSEVLLR